MKKEKKLVSLIEKYYQDNLNIIKAKNADYADDMNSFKNFQLVESLGIATTEAGIVVRMCDKLSRISTLLNKKESVLDETIDDTLSDLANYAMILRAYREIKHDNK